MITTSPQLDALSQRLSELGCPVDTSTVLFPGAERQQVMVHLLRMLVQPVPLETLLQRMEAEEATLSRLAPDERSSYKHAALLSSIGIQASPDQVRGSASYQDSLDFLSNLATTVTQQQELRRAQANAAASVPDDAPSSSPTAAAAPFHHQSARLLEYVCDNTRTLFQESTPLFPSDVTRACQQYSDQASSLLKHQQQLCTAMEAGVTCLQATVDDLSSRVSHVSDQEWSQAHTGCLNAARTFMSALEHFLDIYRRELAVWCESSQKPTTYGFGKQAADMLSVAGRLADMTRIVQTIKTLHAAIATSAAPLQGYARKDMLQQATFWQQEAARLAQEVDVLSSSRDRRDQGQARAAAKAS